MEDISHILADCSQMSARSYLPPRHDEVAKTVMNSHLKDFCPDKQITFPNDPEYIYRKHPREYWWNISITTATKKPHNKPDLVTWNKETKVCMIIEFSYPLATNIGGRVSKKLETNGPLVQNLQILYPNYKYEIAPIIRITPCLFLHLGSDSNSNVNSDFGSGYNQSWPSVELVFFFIYGLSK